MKVGLASPHVATSLDDGLERVGRLVAEAAARGARIVCFPEAYLPGLRGQEFAVLDWGRGEQERVTAAARSLAREHEITVILGVENLAPTGREIAALVVGASGEVLGMQAKTQIDPSEDRYYVPGTGRRLFEADGVRFGITICHEGWRYPETVRFAAVRGAKIVFQCFQTGSDRRGVPLSVFGSPEAAYYEKAMQMRAIENTIYFASVNYALRYPEAATCVIGPSGRCEAFLPYGDEGVLVHDLDLAAATGLIASRYAPERYGAQ